MGRTCRREEKLGSWVREEELEKQILERKRKGPITRVSERRGRKDKMDTM